MQHQPGSYQFTFADFDVEGTWHWNVAATDDLGRVSTVDRPFRFDRTLAWARRDRALRPGR